MKIKTHVEGINFFDRLEVRFMISWLYMIYAPEDSVSMMTYFKDMAKNAIMKFGVGDKAENIFHEACREGGLELGLSALALASTKTKAFVKLIRSMRETLSGNTDISLVILAISRLTGLDAALAAQIKSGDLTAETRMNSIHDLSDMAKGITLNALNDISCLSREETTKENAVRCMTVHSAKGMEYDNVFVAQFCEESFRMQSDETGEGWRLAYVAVTRARKRLSLSYSRFRYGSIATMPSILSANKALFSIFPREDDRDARIRELYS